MVNNNNLTSWWNGDHYKSIIASLKNIWYQSAISSIFNGIQTFWILFIIKNNISLFFLFDFQIYFEPQIVSIPVTIRESASWRLRLLRYLVCLARHVAMVIPRTAVGLKKALSIVIIWSQNMVPETKKNTE